MNSVDILKEIFAKRFNELAKQVQEQLYSTESHENIKKELNYPESVNNFILEYKQSKIDKRTKEYKRYYNLFLKKKEESPELFAPYNEKDFSSLIRFNRDFKNSLDS